MIRNRYWEYFKIVLDDDINNVVKFIIEKFTPIYEEEMINFICDRYTIKVMNKTSYECLDCKDKISCICCKKDDKNRTFFLYGYCDKHVNEEVILNNKDKIWDEMNVYSSLYQYVGEKCENKRKLII